MGRSHRRLVLGSLVLGASLAVLAPPPAVHADETAPTKTSATFELAPDAGLIRVTVELQVTNLIPSTTVAEVCPPGYINCSTTTDYYINQTSVNVHPDGVNFGATTPGGTASVSVESPGEEFLSIATVTHPETFYGQTRAVTLTYEIPAGARDSKNRTRAGMAYASFCGFPGGAYTGDLESLRIVVPDRYEVEQFVGEDLAVSFEGGMTILASEERPTSASEDAGSVCVEAVDESAFVVTEHTSPGGIRVITEAWPEDEEWQRAVSGSVGQMLDRLEEAVGRPPRSDEIVVREVLAERLGGYAGEFDPTESLARVSDDALDPTVAAHELAHAWFNGEFTRAVWINEGYAEVFARSVVTPAVPACDDPGEEARTGVELGEWFYLPAQPEEADFARVQDHYAVACWIVTQIVQRTGWDAMRDIIAAAWEGEIAYVGDGDPERRGLHEISWREWTDLVDERGLLPAGVTDLEWLQELLLESGVTTDDDRLAERADGRERYHELLAATDPWSPPMAIRRELADWSFDDAQEAMATAFEINAAHDSAVELVPEVADSTGVERAYEDASLPDDLEAALDVAEDELDAAETVDAAVSVAEREPEPIEWVGLIGDDLGAEAAAAVDALVASDFDTARERGDAALETASGAARSGALRLGGAAALLGLSAAAYLFARRRRRIRRWAGSP